MKSVTFEQTWKSLLEIHEIEPVFDIESLNKASPDNLLIFQDDIYKPIKFASFDFKGDLPEYENELPKIDNWVSEDENFVELANTAATPSAVIKNDDLLVKKKVDNAFSNPEQSKSTNPDILPQEVSSKDIFEEDKYGIKSESDSCSEVNNEDSDYDEGQLCNRKKKSTVSKIVDNQRKIMIRRTTHKRQEGVILKRWDRNTDRDLFRLLRSKLKSLTMSIEEFIYDDTTEIFDEDNQIILWEIRLNILESLIERFEWLNTPYFLFKRIRKLWSGQ